MKTIGLIGGMSWESTSLYYQLINRAVSARLGGLHSAQVLMYSVDFHEIEELQRTDRWQEAGARLAEIAHTLERGGADFLVLCTNTMHIVADAITAAVRIESLRAAAPRASSSAAPKSACSSDPPTRPCRPSTLRSCTRLQPPRLRWASWLPAPAI